MKKSRYIFLTLGILMTIFIFSQSMKPGEVSGQQSGVITDIIDEALTNLNVEVERDVISFSVRKLAHFTEFFFFGFFWFMFFKSFGYSYSTYILTLNYGLIVGITDELIQSFVPDRAMQGIDVLIDVSGVLFFLVIAFIINKIKDKNNINKKVS